MKRKSASGPFQREDPRSSTIVFIRFHFDFVASLFEVVFGKELPYSDPGLFETMFVFRKHWIYRISISFILLNHFKYHSNLDSFSKLGIYSIISIIFINTGFYLSFKIIFKMNTLAFEIHFFDNRLIGKHYSISILPLNLLYSSKILFLRASGLSLRSTPLLAYIRHSLCRSHKWGDVLVVSAYSILIQSSKSYL